MFAPGRGHIGSVPLAAETGRVWPRGRPAHQTQTIRDNRCTSRTRTAMAESQRAGTPHSPGPRWALGTRHRPGTRHPRPMRRPDTRSSPRGPHLPRGPLPWRWPAGASPSLWPWWPAASASGRWTNASTPPTPQLRTTGTPWPPATGPRRSASSRPCLRTGRKLRRTVRTVPPSPAVCPPTRSD